MTVDELLLEYPGTYGGSASRDELRRVLKEALAIVENTSPDTELICSGFRIEVLRQGRAGD